MDNTNSYFDNGLCSGYNGNSFNCFEKKSRNLIEELCFMKDTYVGENKEYFELTINRLVDEIESLPDEEKEIFKEMDIWMFLLIVFCCYGSLV